MKQTMIGMTVLAMALGLASVAGAHGSGHKRVKIANCTDQRILVCTFDGSDSETRVGHDSKKPNAGEKKTLTCHGQGRGGCKVKMALDATSECGDRKGQLFDGRHKGYFRINGNDDDDLVEIDKEEYDTDDPCTDGVE